MSIFLSLLSVPEKEFTWATNLCLCSKFSWLQNHRVNLLFLWQTFSFSFTARRLPLHFDLVKSIKMGCQHHQPVSLIYFMQRQLFLSQSIEPLYRCFEFSLTRTTKPKHVFLYMKGRRIWPCTCVSINRPLWGLFGCCYFRRLGIESVGWRAWVVVMCLIKRGRKLLNIPVSLFYKPLVAHLISNTQNPIFIQLDSAVI